MEAVAESLFKSLEQIPDPGRASGVRHPFQAILRLTLLGLVSGQTTMAHMALFGKLRWTELKEPLGFVRESATPLYPADWRESHSSYCKMR